MGKNCTMTFAQRNGEQIPNHFSNPNLADDEKGPFQYYTHMNTVFK